MNDKQKTLEDLVPPLELCKAAREVIGERTAMVWEVYRCQYSVDPYVMSRETSETTRGSAVASDYPAPTLAELLEMLPGNCPWIEKHEMKTPVEYAAHSSRFTGSAHAGHGSERDANPATAALRLLMKVKGVTQ